MVEFEAFPTEENLYRILYPGNKPIVWEVIGPRAVSIVLTILIVVIIYKPMDVHQLTVYV